ncbi:MAG: DNA-processing protein DprA, partial [Acidimicrobiales bacterium]
MPTDELPPQAYAAALAAVPSIRTQYLRTLLGTVPPCAAWASVVAGGPWAAEARRVDVAATWRAHRDAGVEVLVAGDGRYPRVLAGEPAAPAVLFALGDPRVADRHPRVAVVGTRSATRYGLGMAAQLGAELAAAGVAVVSGLALGIDGAAHEGAVGAWRAAGGSAAPPVAVVPRALDEPYPRSHRRLWDRVASAGAVLSDAPVGTDVPRWRFPHRNRIMAALADVVVVVECHATGGSLHTVRAAVRRGRSVGAVPGSVRSPASAGTNDLLADGCFVVRDVTDVLVALGLARAGAVPMRPRRRADREEPGGGVAVAAGEDDGCSNGGRDGAPGTAGNGHA